MNYKKIYPYKEQPYFLESQLLYGKDKNYVDFMNDTRIIPPKKTTIEESQLALVKLKSQQFRKTQQIPLNALKMAYQTSVESNLLIDQLTPKTGIFRRRPTSAQMEQPGLRTSAVLRTSQGNYRKTFIPNCMIVSSQ